MIDVSVLFLAFQYFKFEFQTITGERTLMIRYEEYNVVVTGFNKHNLFQLP